MGLARGRVEEVKGAELLDDDPAGAGRGRLEVESVVRQGLVDLLGREVIDEERYGASPVGQEVDLVADPHRVRVVGVVARDLLDLEVGERDDPDRRRLAATVAFPGRLPVHRRHVGQARAVGGEGRGHACRKRQFLGETAVHPDREERRDAGGARPARAENDALAVRGPAEDLVRVGVVGQPARHAARGRNDKNVGIPVVLARECDRFAVGRERRIVLDPDAGRQPRGRSAVARREPEVAGISEHDFRPAERRVLGQERLFGRDEGRARRDRHEKRRDR